MLLILDNCEHLVDACARMADRILHAAHAGVSMMRDEWGQDQIYVVIETALQTRSGQQQSGARDFLTHLPSIINGTTSINGIPVPLSKGQCIIPVIKNTARPDGDVLHEVQYGQSLGVLLSRIARPSSKSKHGII